MALPNCIQCGSEYTYEDQGRFICPECGAEWSQEDLDSDDDAVVDSLGNPLKSGDTVTVIKDLKVKGSSSVVKVGTKIKNIRLIDSDHSVECKLDKMGTIQITPKFVKKV